MLQSTQSPLCRFVLVCFCLALAGSLTAGVHYLAIDLPHQAVLKAPANHFFDPDCYAAYEAATGICAQNCRNSQGETDYDCYWPCERVALCTMQRCDGAKQSIPESSQLVQYNC